MSEQNPYAAPEADLMPAAEPTTELDTARKEHLKAEINVKAVGGLVLVATVVSFFETVVAVMKGAFDLAHGITLAAVAVAGAAALLIRRLNPIGRILYSLLAATMLLSSFAAPGLGLRSYWVPMLILGLLTTVLWTPKAGFVFSERYRMVIVPATPHVAQASRLGLLLILALLLPLMLLAVWMIAVAMTS